MGVDLYVANLTAYFQDVLVPRSARDLGRPHRVYVAGAQPPWLGLKAKQANQLAESIRDRVAKETGISWSESSCDFRHRAQLGNLADAGILQECAIEWFKHREPELRHLRAWPNAWLPGDFEAPIRMDLDKFGTFEVASAGRIRNLVSDLAGALESPSREFPDVDLIKHCGSWARSNAATATRILMESIEVCMRDGLPLVRD